MREQKLMNKGWRYFFGSPDYKKPKNTSSDQQYRGSRAENARGPARRDYDDSAWETVTVPHDFVAKNGLSETDPFGGEHFDFPRDRGEAWYRRTFRLEPSDRDRRIMLRFEGVATVSEVYVNSMLLKVNRTAGIGFDVDITDVARFGCDYNVVAVHADCHDYEAWYYEGGGITRKVWLITTGPLAIDPWGTFVRTKNLGGGAWQLDIETEITNHYDKPREAELISTIVDPDGRVSGSAISKEMFICGGSAMIRQRVVVRDPRLWDTSGSNLYTLKTELRSENGEEDACETRFGIREITFDSEKGMFLNGKSVKIYGFANHMCYLGVGDAMSDSQREFHIRTIREMGGNGFRTAHSPHGSATYDYCDQYGLLVMDENRVFHSSEIGMDEVRRMVRRDRNHPSVCMWSLYNEEDTITRETGRRIFRTLAAEIRKLDDTRPVTGATSYGMFTEGACDDQDIFGFNHQTMNVEALHRAHPGKPIFCSEMILPIGPKPIWMDQDVRPGEDALQMRKDYFIGGFCFTAWEYGPNRAEIFDGLGGKGTRYYGLRAFLRPDEPLAHVCPGWDFPGMEGQTVDLWLANNGDYVEVYVNGEYEARIDTDLYAATPCRTIYRPGEIRIVAYKDGKIWAEDIAETPGVPAAIRLVMENPSLKADDDDVAIVTAYLVDKEGRVCAHDTGREVCFESNAAGSFICAATVREDGFQGYHGPRIRFFEGKAQAYFRSLAVPGNLIVTAESKGLRSGALEIERIASDIVHVPVVETNFINDWSISKLFLNAMDDAKIMREHQIERWEHIDTQGSPDILNGHIGPFADVPEGTTFHYALYACVTVPDLGARPEGAALGLHFEGIDGPANIYVTDGMRTAIGHHASNAPWYGHYRPELLMLCDAFKPGDRVEVWVMIHDAGRVNGIGWPVRWVYTTQAEADALEAKTLREWRSSGWKG